MNHVTVMFRREAYDRSGGYRQCRWVEDWDLFHRMFMAGVRFANLAEVLVQVRCGRGVHARRRGYAYLRAELALLRRMYGSGFLNIWQLGGNVAVRLVTRTLPAPILGEIYRHLLRQSRPDVLPPTR